VDQALQTVQSQIEPTAGTCECTRAIITGHGAADEVIIARTRDGLNDFVNYSFGPPLPGIYQLTIAGYGLPPDNPQAPYMRMFAIGNTGNIYLAPPPPSVDDPDYEFPLTNVLNIGASDSTSRTLDQTDIALFWRESAPM